MKVKIKQLWIRAESARPQNGEKVIVYSERDGYIGLVQYYNGFNCSEHDNAHEMKDITHWQPLPKPPKGAQKC